MGDALGMPTEGYTAQEILSRFGPIKEMLPALESHFHSGLLAGQFTDDTEETLLLAESLVESLRIFRGELCREASLLGQHLDTG